MQAFREHISIPLRYSEENTQKKTKQTSNKSEYKSHYIYSEKILIKKEEWLVSNAFLYMYVYTYIE